MFIVPYIRHKVTNCLKVQFSKNIAPQICHLGFGGSFGTFRKNILMFFGMFSQLIAFVVSAVACACFLCLQCNFVAKKLSGEVREAKTDVQKKLEKLFF